MYTPRSKALRGFFKAANTAPQSVHGLKDYFGQALDASRNLLSTVGAAMLPLTVAVMLPLTALATNQNATGHVVCDKESCAGFTVDFEPGAAVSWNCNGVGACNGTRFIIEEHCTLPALMDCDNDDFACFGATIELFDSYLGDEPGFLDCLSTSGSVGVCDKMTLDLTNASLRLQCLASGCRGIKAFVRGYSVLELGSSTTLPTTDQLEVFLFGSDAVFVDAGKSPYILHSNYTSTTPIPITTEEPGKDGDDDDSQPAISRTMFILAATLTPILIVLLLSGIGYEVHAQVGSKPTRIWKAFAGIWATATSLLLCVSMWGNGGMLWLAIPYTGFMVAAYGGSLAMGFGIQKLLAKKAPNNAKALETSVGLTVLAVLCTGSFAAAINIMDSAIFGYLNLDMRLTHMEAVRVDGGHLAVTLLLQKIPALCMQMAVFAFTDFSDLSATLFLALISHIISVGTLSAEATARHLCNPSVERTCAVELEFTFHMPAIEKTAADRREVAYDEIRRILKEAEMRPAKIARVMKKAIKDEDAFQSAEVSIGYCSLEMAPLRATLKMHMGIMAAKEDISEAVKFATDNATMYTKSGKFVTALLRVYNGDTKQTENTVALLGSFLTVEVSHMQFHN